MESGGAGWPKKASGEKREGPSPKDFKLPECYWVLFCGVWGRSTYARAQTYPQASHGVWGRGLWSLGAKQALIPWSLGASTNSLESNNS